ncbi:hypothetical protein GAR05_05151 [Micromonospora saelicesensis]|uniref:Uncharacterized protein n=1 Tax=Micromonospora saelicesensis TaxID=285676 RepID=A0ABX9CCX7_9ACTN|nr:hypothetical protein [Micromonospora saelicesensis]RAN93851.1 hypothetical protein GAR05_05151 [Micromonospora saelicesensis]
MTSAAASLIISVAAAAISAVSIIYARRSARAAQQQADIARAQAAIAERQAETAELAMLDASGSTHTAQLTLLEMARQRLALVAPQVVVGVDPLDTPILAVIESSGEVPHDGTDPLDLVSHRSVYISYRVRGTIYNAGERAVCVQLAGGPSFISDENPWQPGSSITPPPSISEHEHLLAAGRYARFEWTPGQSLYRWADDYQKPDEHRLLATIWLRPAGLDAQGGSVRLELCAEPIHPEGWAERRDVRQNGVDRYKWSWKDTYDMPRVLVGDYERQHPDLRELEKELPLYKASRSGSRRL